MELPGVDSPEKPVELPGVAPPENEVDDNVVPPLLKSDYDSDNDSDDKDEDTDMYTQQSQRFIQPEAIPPTVMNVYNLRPWKQNDYVKEKIYQSILFTHFGNDLNKDALYLLKHGGTQNSEETIDYATVIEYEFTQYYLKRRLKEFG